MELSKLNQISENLKNQDLQCEDYSLKNFIYIKRNNKKVILGKGSFAKVYLVKHKISQKYFAIK